jgi:coenzyme F420-dependent glucose-6-phosphate dehydrogenase
VLLGHAKRADAAGFRHAMCSDHFHPWSARQGQSGFAWSWLGAALQATKLTFGTVNAPGQRYHPAVVAQAAGTLAILHPGRFWLAVGSGENLNESITGQPWPPREVRQQRLRDSALVMQRLWDGHELSTSGTVRVAHARLWSCPTHPPLLVGAALSEETARFVGGFADALITATADPEVVRRMARAFADGGGTGKPVYVQSAIAWASTEEEGLRAVHDQWRHCVLSREDFADLPTPAAFDARVEAVGVEEVRGQVPVVTDARWLVDWLGRMQAAGAHRVYLHDVARNVERFISEVGEHVLPAFGA